MQAQCKQNVFTISFIITLCEKNENNLKIIDYWRGKYLIYSIVLKDFIFCLLSVGEIKSNLMVSFEKIKKKEN